jgi:ZIP family zinc transporter
MTTTLIIGLLIPAMDMEVNSGKWAVMPAAIGFLLGMGFLLLIDELTPHLHIGTDKPEGQHSNLSTIGFVLMMVLDVVMG